MTFRNFDRTVPVGPLAGHVAAQHLDSGVDLEASVDVVTVREASKSFGSIPALDGANLSVQRGSVHGLLGRNGAGKTTLLRALLGLVRLDSGQVQILGEQPRSIIARRAGVAGFVDVPRFYPYLSVRKNLEMMSAFDGARATDDGPAIDRVIEICGLADVARRRAAVLSTGQSQRLGLAAALLRQPRVLIVDEPTTGLDPLGILDLHTILREMAQRGVAVLLSSHDMAEVELMCDAVTVLGNGRTLYTGSMAGLRARAPDPTYLLITSDDSATIALSAPGVEIRRHTEGHLLLKAAAEPLEAFTMSLGRSGIAIRELHRQDTGLQVMFLELIASLDCTS